MISFDNRAADVLHLSSSIIIVPMHTQIMLQIMHSVIVRSHSDHVKPVILRKHSIAHHGGIPCQTNASVKSMKMIHYKTLVAFNVWIVV